MTEFARTTKFIAVKYCTTAIIMGWRWRLSVHYSILMFYTLLAEVSFMEVVRETVFKLLQSYARNMMARIMCAKLSRK